MLYFIRYCGKIKLFKMHRSGSSLKLKWQIRFSFLKCWPTDRYCLIQFFLFFSSFLTVYPSPPPPQHIWVLFTPCVICRSIFYGVFHQVALKAQNVRTTWCTYQLRGLGIIQGIAEDWIMFLQLVFNLKNTRKSDQYLNPFGKKKNLQRGVVMTLKKNITIKHTLQ